MGRSTRRGIANAAREALAQFPRRSHCALMFSTTLMIIQATTSTSNCIMHRAFQLLSKNTGSQNAPCAIRCACECSQAHYHRLLPFQLIPGAPPVHKYDAISLELSCSSPHTQQKLAQSEEPRCTATRAMLDSLSRTFVITRTRSVRVRGCWR